MTVKELIEKLQWHVQNKHLNENAGLFIRDEGGEYLTCDLELSTLNKHTAIVTLEGL